MIKMKLMVCMKPKPKASRIYFCTKKVTIVEIVKTKINIDDAKDALGKIAGLFGKN